ncbi:Pycsar system effector family protein [Mucilaginibacter sp.]|uniref:Pycsar system effector family protein n=1 Tax=Mucilaginibacter sp. TaxID=1882438 RepID=UPI0035BC0EB6
MEYQRSLQYVKAFVDNYYSKHTKPCYVYHNKKHITDVASHVKDMAAYYQLNERDRFIVLAATWLHDLGYMTDKGNHEEAGATIAESFLAEQGFSSKDIDAVKCCIMATKVPQEPLILLEQIVCDANLYTLGTADFFKDDKLLRKEKKLLHHGEIKKKKWWHETISFLESHNYHTEYCRMLLNTGKHNNLCKLKEKLGQQGNSGIQSKVEKPVRGIETMFKISSGNHQRLSDMADNKAHIMITVNSIILSAIISLVLRKIGEYHYLVMPILLLLSISLITMIFAILATRPTLPHGTFTKADVSNKVVNLIFFGNFYKMNYEDYDSGMQQVMADKGFLYGTLKRDIYAQGVVLGRKYYLLRLAYNVFMYGLIISVLAFVVALACANLL